MVAIADPYGTNGTDGSDGLAALRVEAIVVASSAVTNKQAVAFTMAVDGTLRCAPADTDVHDPAVKVGVALEDIASGYAGRVCVSGPCIVNTPATGPSAQEVAILTSDAGVLDGAVADATTVAGDIHGVFLTDEIGSTNTSWVWLK